MHQDIEKIILDSKEIEQKIEEIAGKITSDYEGKEPLMVCILRGAAFFYTDLCKKIKLPVHTGFVSLSSYGNSATSSGSIKIRQPLGWDVAGRDVILVEDIIDSGRTMCMYEDELLKQGANSVEICSLLKKPSQVEAVDVKYIGFDIGDDFVVGYGLDYAENYRNLEYIGILKKEIYSHE